MEPNPSSKDINAKTKHERPTRRITPLPPGTPHPQVTLAQAHDVLSLLLLFRFLNALLTRTFFQPDEYFQSLEPAWHLAFSDSSAWLTWEWTHQLRSSLYPALIATFYRGVDGVMGFLQLYPPFRALILTALPGAVQSVVAAVGDFFTWKLGMDLYGRGSNAPWAALWVSVVSPWGWYVSTRTFSNSMEMGLTVAGVSYWPWEILKGEGKGDGELLLVGERVRSLRISLVLAALAVVLRPTNILIWVVILGMTLVRLARVRREVAVPTLVVLFREIILCGGAVLALSVLSDKLYFGFWTFPPYKWLYFNISQSLAVFYGHMQWHYYLSQGIPLLMTTFLPFALVGVWKGLFPRDNSWQSAALKTLATTVVTVVAIMSLISHKEVRFIYPLLPMLHILSAPYVAAFFTTPESNSSTFNGPVVLRRKLTLANLLTINLLLGTYLSVFHQPAPLSVLQFLRTDFERIHPESLWLGTDLLSPDRPPNQGEGHELFALFLTPCHSTPWRSHLVYPALRARALTCEPPLHTRPGSVERETYRDEADRFYLRDPKRNNSYGLTFLANELFPLARDGSGRRGGEVPRYIVGFEGIESVLREFFESEDGEGKEMGVRLTRVWSGFNGLFNEDWRRRGRLVVWDTGVYEGSAKPLEENTEERGEKEEL